MLKKGDIILTLSMVAVIAVSFVAVRMFRNAGENTGKIAVIKQNDKVIKTIDLQAVNGPVRVEILGEYNNIVLMEEGRIRFESASCPDHVCVRTGWLSRRGDTAVCLPNRSIIKIEGKAEDVDGVTY